jgi:pyruvate dehydrogenase E2 component (dihydrolipoamide acetyltransferase)
VRVGAPLADIETEDAVADTGTVVGMLPPALAQRTSPDERPKAASEPVRIRASPAVRARATELGIALADVRGSGPGGVVTREDVEAAAQLRQPASGYEPLRGMRRAMAEAVARSAAGVVSATVTDEALIEAWSEQTDPTIRLVRAIVAGCHAAPELNAWLDRDGKARRLHETIDLALAMETEAGLFAPVLRNIEARDDQDLRRGLDAMKKDVASRAVPRAELRDPTLTLSNFGMLGGLNAVLTIVPPQVSILGAGRIHKAARVVGNEVRAVRVLPLSLSFDHRAVTGAEAIRFLTAVIAELEKA